MLFHFTFQMATRCIICDLTFSSLENLRRHMNTIHMKRDTLKCPHCEYTSTRNDNIRRHLKQAHKRNPSEDMIEPAKRPRVDQTCSICHNYTTNDTSNMKRHMKVCTLRNKTRKVNKGGDASEDDHERGTEKRKRDQASNPDDTPRKRMNNSMKCDYCTYTTTKTSNLKRHEAICKNQVSSLRDTLQVVPEDASIDIEEVDLEEPESHLAIVAPKVHSTIRPEFLENWKSIRTHFSEPANDDPYNINHAFYTIRHDPNTDWAATLVTIFRRQTKRFKLNYGHSFIYCSKKL